MNLIYLGVELNFGLDWYLKVLLLYFMILWLIFIGFFFFGLYFLFVFVVDVIVVVVIFIVVNVNKDFVINLFFMLIIF